jgi:endonuclease VIII
MPEGDTIFRAAQTLQRALAGHVVTRFESVYPHVMRVAEDRPVIGRTIDAVRSRGKHILMTFSGGLTLHTHMRMNGSWHIYRQGERWQRPARDMRIVVATDTFVAVGFSVPIAELLTDEELARHEELRELGPDLLDPDFDSGEAVRRLRAHAGEAIGDALLNQRVMSGIGNVFKSEILFVARVEPFRSVGGLTDEELERIVSTAKDLLRASVLPASRTLSMAVGRRTTRSLDPNEKLWVYGRGRKPCRKCGTPIEARKTGIDARLTYWCPRCQSSR